MESYSACRTTRAESSNASACPTSSRFSAISPSRFSSLASSPSREGQGRTAIPDLLRAQAKRRVSRHSDGVVDVLVACQTAVDRRQQISERELLVGALPGVSRQSVLRDRAVRPVREPKFDVRKSTFNEPLKLSWNGLVCFSPIGCWPPWRPHRALAPMNKDAQGRRKVERSESNWKCGLRGKGFQGWIDGSGERRLTSPIHNI